MGHSIHKRYRMKLNKSVSSYDGLLTVIHNYLSDCYKVEESSQERGEHYSASIKESAGELVVSFCNYKSNAPVALSSDIVRLVKDNINTNTAQYYYYLEEEGQGNWPIREVYGKADIIASTCPRWFSNGASNDESLKKFHDSLYAGTVTSMQLTDTISITKLIEALEIKGREICYLDNDVNRILIPLWRNPDDGAVLLYGQAYRKDTVTLYKMTFNKSSKKRHIVELDMNTQQVEDFVHSHQKEIASNLRARNMIAVAIKRESFRNDFTGVDFHYSHFRKIINLFNDDGPLIEVEDTIN